MAPKCPEEVDVFSIPHSRMKELVKKYLNMVSEINFEDISHLTNLLENLVNTFKEFKAHEHIENKYIMKRLKEKLRALSIRNTALCNCHSDNRLTDILELVQDGYKCTQKTEIDRKNFGTKLRKALEDFTEKFIPHMEEEEEVFQPMLIKYFTVDELKQIKCKVLEKHFCREDCVKHELLEKLESSSSESSDEDCSEKLESTKEKVKVTRESDVGKLPDEITLKIFSYLNPQELGQCAQVSHQWNRLALDGSLWRNFLPVQWSKGNWSFVSSIDEEAEEEKLLQEKTLLDELYIDEDADIDESEGNEEDIQLVKQIKNEGEMLMCMVKHLLPRVGQGVKVINLAYSKGLVNSSLYKILSLCPTVESLDLTHTRISDFGFKSLGKNGCGSSLREINLMGCSKITDVTLERLSMALQSQLPSKVQQNKNKDEYAKEKNEIESNEKEVKSQKSTDLCHSSCSADIRIKMEAICDSGSSVVPMNDIEDHFNHDLPQNLLTKQNQNANHTKFLSDWNCETNNCGEKSSELTFTQEISSLNKTTTCCQHSYGSSSTNDLKNHNENHFYKHFQDSDLQQLTWTKESAVEHKHDIFCDNTNCELEYLNLSGCCLITDRGIRALAANQMFPHLQFLDLSGCDQVTAYGLTCLVSMCSSLDHQFLYYCDNITEDPYFESASGCQNLECPTRSCCRTVC